jgi:hypothetical protein
MATIKSYTDIEQSKALAKILPLESADMYYPWDIDSKSFLNVPIIKDDSYYVQGSVPCWSLASLLEVLKQHCERLGTTVILNKNYNVFASGNGFTYRSLDGISNLIDAYYKIVIHLNELNLL